MYCLNQRGECDWSLTGSRSGACWRKTNDCTAWLIPGLWLLGTLYHAYLRFRLEPEENLALTIREFTKDIGIVGLSAAILVLTIISARRFGMALFDWANRDKTRAKRDAEWMRWLERKERAERDGVEFDEPSPADRGKEAEVA